MTTRARCLAALGALLLLGIAVVTTVLAVIGDLWRIPVAVALLAAALLAAWFAVTRTGARRALAGLLAVVAVAAFVVVSLGSSGLVSIALRVALVVAAVGLIRYVVAHDPGLLPQDATPAQRVPPAVRGVLIMNLKSGGGKAERFGLEEQCRARGIGGVVLRPGDDLVELAEGAVDGGADVIGMAGGDGSQALVASVAARRGVAMVVVPAGTRNHLALDLGLDRDDVVGALDAFGEAQEQPMDLAEVNGRVFVNNVSLGLYAAIVRSPEYRAAKVDTALGALPAALGPGSTPFDLHFTGPDGEPHDGAHVVQVSNNPYGRTAGTRTVRPHLDTGHLGVVALVLSGGRAAESFVAAVAVNHPERFPGFVAWEPTTFQIDSGSEIDVGLDGEALRMQPPLRFTVRPAVLRIRRPTWATSHAPTLRELSLRSTLGVLWRAALGRPAREPLALA
jgi:diacylglycerol kinase family enzyme